MNDPHSDDRNRLEAAAEEFVARKRAGELPRIEEYAERYPELALEIAELFPVVAMLDQANPGLQEIGPGTTLGDYQLIRRIGKGGMGIVYQAEHVVLGSKVAIKILPSSLDRPKLRERFLREASAAARMHHPNIVTVFDFGTHAESLYYAMTLVEGWGLNDIIEGMSGAPSISQMAERGMVSSSSLNRPTFENPAFENPAFENPAFENEFASSTTSSQEKAQSNWGSGSGSHNVWSWVAGVGVQAADAIAYAHSVGVIHRDIKPANLMLDADGMLCITDFGLAKVADAQNLTHSGDMLGTLRYMPPEAFGGSADQRGDIYGLGITLYEVCSGIPAFTGSDAARIVPEILAGRFTKLRTRVPKLPVDLETVIEKAIATDPAARYDSAGELRDDLRRFLQGRPVLARKTTWVYKTTRWIDRNRVITSLMAGIFLLMSCVLIVLLVSARSLAKLAEEKENQRQSATAAEMIAVEQTRKAKRNLLLAGLSDARGWSLSRRPGQRVEGLKSLSEAISLARELNVFEQFQEQFQTIAVALSTLNDIPEGRAWRHPVRIGEYESLAFNGDLSVYACESLSDNTTEVEIYEVTGDQPRLLESITLPGELLRQSLIMSKAGNLVVGAARNSPEDHRPWIYDRETKKVHQPPYSIVDHGRDARIFSVMGEKRLIFATVDHRLVLFDVRSGMADLEIEIPVSKTQKNLNVRTNHDGSFTAIYGSYLNEVFLFDMKSHEFERFPINTAGIYHLTWRPDDRQLAVVGSDDKVHIWDIERKRYSKTLDYSHVRTTHAEYCSNRLLLTTGWNHRTVLHDTMSEKRVLQVGAFMQKVSDDGLNVLLHTGGRFEIRPIVQAKVLIETAIANDEIDPSSIVDAANGLCWIAFVGGCQVLDLSRFRVHDVHKASLIGDQIALDPAGRDLFLSGDHMVRRFPIEPGSAENPKLKIGPPELICRSKNRKQFEPGHIILDHAGDRLAVASRVSHCELVFHREPLWQLATHSHATEFPHQLSLHPTRPLVATAVHHGKALEVRDTKTDVSLFNFPMKQSSGKFSPDGTTLFLAGDGLLRKYSTDTWQLLSQTGPDIVLKKYSFSVSADGRWIAMETALPEGVTILDAATLQPTLLLQNNYEDVFGTPGQLDSTGRYLVCGRSRSLAGIWDFYELRQVFSSLSLDWPLDGLGDFVPIRSPEIAVEIDWDLESSGADSSGQELSAYEKLRSSLTRTGLLDQFWVPRLTEGSFLPADAKNDGK